MKNIDVFVKHLTRIEGHGNIVVSVKDGRVQEARLDIVESPRFFEVMLQGRPHTDAAWITSRICGICAVSHTTASLSATEDAFGVQPSEQTMLLRKLIFHGEVIQSHILHVYFLVAPDFFGTGSVIPLAGTHKDVVVCALSLKKLGNDICAVVGGRHVHPVSMALNGFTKLPDEARLKDLRARLISSRKDLDATVELFKNLSIPAFERETEYLSLTGVDEYPFCSGDILSSSGDVTPYRKYKETIKETVIETSSAKRVNTTNGPFMVGALARFNNNHRLLHPRAHDAARALGLIAPCHNPFMISTAQLVETIHCVEDSIALIDTLLARGMKEEPRDVTPVRGRGVGVVEAPRGTLYHDYTYDEAGSITDANCIIPTGQNLANIEEDMRAIMPTLLGKPVEETAQVLKMLVRAYDPCISCSTHELEVAIKSL